MRFFPTIILACLLCLTAANPVVAQDAFQARLKQLEDVVVSGKAEVAALRDRLAKAEQDIASINARLADIGKSEPGKSATLPTTLTAAAPVAYYYDPAYGGLMQCTNGQCGPVGGGFVAYGGGFGGFMGGAGACASGSCGPAAGGRVGLLQRLRGR